MDTLIATLHGMAITAGFFGVVGVAFLQEIFPPLPSTAVAMSLGFLLFAGEPMTLEIFVELFFKVGLPIAVGLTVGAIIIYYIVAKGGLAIIDRWGAWLGVTRADIERLQARMQGTAIDDVLLFVARAFPLVPSIAVNVVAGLAGWRIVPFIILTFTGTIVRAMWSAWIGWQIGSAFEEYAIVIERIHTAIVLLVAAGMVLFIWYRRRKLRGGTIDTLPN